MVAVGFLALFAAVAVVYAFRFEEEGLVAVWALSLEPDLIFLNTQNLFG
jgi:hypothetical protein